MIILLCLIIGLIYSIYTYVNKDSSEVNKDSSEVNKDSKPVTKSVLANQIIFLYVLMILLIVVELWFNKTPPDAA